MPQSKVVEFERAAIPAVSSQTEVGWVVRADDQGIWVDYSGNARGPQLALSTIRIARSELELAIKERRDAVLLFCEGHTSPILIGLGQSEPVIEAEAVGLTPSAAEVDGKRVRIDGEDEVVLRCGKASITLRRNGRVVIRGVQVESRASGRNRIKGGAVLIN